MVTRISEFLHLPSCLSKPYTLQRQQEIAFSQVKRVKRESYALKLAVLNKSTPMLKFLIDGAPTYFVAAGSGLNQLSQVWNLGHIAQCLRYMIRDDWLEGIACLFRLRRVKQVVQSVNDPKSFLDMLNALLQMLTAPGLKMDTLKAITASLNQEPYYLLLLLLQLYFK